MHGIWESGSVNPASPGEKKIAPVDGSCPIAENALSRRRVPLAEAFILQTGPHPVILIP